MQVIILTVSLAAFSPIVWVPPAHGAAIENPCALYGAWAEAGDQYEPTDTDRQPDAWDRLSDIIMDRLTVPLDPDDQRLQPLWIWPDHWIATDHRGDIRGGAWRERLCPNVSSSPRLRTGIASLIAATQSSTRDATPRSETTTHARGYPCDTS